MTALQEVLRLIAMRPGQGDLTWQAVQEDRELGIRLAEGQLTVFRRWNVTADRAQGGWELLPSDTPEQVRATFRWLDTGDEP